ncbi:MAG: hypothetical protein J5804_00455 [Eggerthellaceae bacterium]|nr:hypothetical protein [Eggerthellaceae bacterium]
MPADDEVPLDVYDSMVSSYDDEYAGYTPSYYDSGDAWDGAQPHRASAQRSSQDEPIYPRASVDAASAPSRTECAQPQNPIQPEPAMPVESALQAQESGANADDYSKMISNSMGIDIVFKEVDE